MAHRNGIALRLVEPDTPHQNAYVGLSNNRHRDEYLDEYWLMSLHHVRVVIEAWRRVCKEERLKKSLVGLMPPLYTE